MFSKDADSSRPDLTKASPVPLAHPSHPPPAPPGTTKCNFSIAIAELERAPIMNKKDINFMNIFFIIYLSVLKIHSKLSGLTINQIFKEIKKYFLN
jgi:hypothetical protein|tara:strand:+ start:598 stop:885 length:288 start_codon:yes stop_codon:yes gene_type:complete